MDQQFIMTDVIPDGGKAFYLHHFSTIRTLERKESGESVLNKGNEPKKLNISTLFIDIFILNEIQAIDFNFPS